MPLLDISKSMKTKVNQDSLILQFCAPLLGR